MAECTIKLTEVEHAMLCAVLNHGWDCYWVNSKEEADRFEKVIIKFTSAKPEKRKEQK